MRYPSLRFAPLAVAAFGAMLAVGCASGASIDQLKTNPGRYMDRSVTVEGTVVNAWGVPFVPLKMYQIDDGTGEMTVVADNHQRVPSRGAQVRVTGRVQEFAVVGGRSIGLHLRERDLDYVR
jgi:hypothetical protein